MWWRDRFERINPLHKLTTRLGLSVALCICTYITSTNECIWCSMVFSCIRVKIFPLSWFSCRTSASSYLSFCTSSSVAIPSKWVCPEALWVSEMLWTWKEAVSIESTPPHPPEIQNLSLRLPPSYLPLGCLSSGWYVYIVTLNTQHWYINTDTCHVLLPWYIVCRYYVTMVACVCVSLCVFSHCYQDSDLTRTL